MSRSIPPIAVIDFETTGLFPKKHDRVIEVGIVILEGEGSVVREFSTLVNPQRDIGAARIHGIESREILDAPCFLDVAGHILDVMHGVVAVVAHNVMFDDRFLRHEFSRIGIELPEYQRLCTMRLSGGGKLHECCSDFGIVNEHPHYALYDAHYAAKLFWHIVKDDVFLSNAVSKMTPVAWPNAPKKNTTFVQRSATSRAGSCGDNYISNLVRKMEMHREYREADKGVLEYIDLLDRALEDRFITDVEAENLADTAIYWGLDIAGLQRLHSEYLTEMVNMAFSDGVLSEIEKQDIVKVGNTLGFTGEALEALFSKKSEIIEKPINRDVVEDVTSSSSLNGKKVCFTGESCCRYQGRYLTRELSVQLVESKGMVAASSVTKSLDILVVSDSHTQSGKAVKARKYSVRIIHEVAFWRLLNIHIE